MTSVTIVLPPRDDSEISEGLITLTKMIHEKHYANAIQGLLGGEFGYGCDFENSTFKMRGYCWCEKDSCPQCGHNEPNFFHKPSQSQIWWYKYIGRGMHVNLTTSWDNIYIECVTSLGQPPGKEAA